MSKSWIWFLLGVAFPLSLLSLPPDRSAQAEVAVVLSEGTEYKAFFLRGDEIQQLMGDLIDLTDEGMLAKLGGASGGVISGDRHNATLKPGEKVYAVVKVLKDVRIERMRAVLETRVTQNPRGLSLAAALHQNYFGVKYIDFSASGGQVSYADSYIRETSTQDRPYMIVTPSGDKLFYFSYQSYGGSAGIRTKITYHFTTGPAILDICPRQMFTSCYDIDKYLIDVPEPTGDPCADWAYYNSRCFEQDVRNKLKCAILCNTEPYVNVPGHPHADEKRIKLRVDGFSSAELSAVAAANDVRIGAPGVTTVNTVAVSTIANPTDNMPETWLEVTFTVNQGVHGCQTVVVGETALESPVCSPIPETFLKMIADSPPKYSGQKVFVGMRVVGATDSYTFNVSTEGTHVVFSDSGYQRFNVGCVKYLSPTALCVSTTLSNCAVIGSFTDEGISEGTATTPIAWPPATTPICTPMQPVQEAALTLEIYKPKVIDPNEIMIPNDKKLSQGSMTWVNLDNDDKDGKFDNTDDVVAGGDDELVKIKLVLPKGLSTGVVKLSATAGGEFVKVWKKNDKSAASAYVLDSALAVPKDFTAEGNFPVKELWVEGVKEHTKQQQTILKMTYDKSPNRSDEVALTVVGSNSLKWIGKGNGWTEDGLHNSNTLGVNPNFPEGDRIPVGQRVFPDARAPNFDKALNTVELEITLSVKPVENLDIYIKSFDVDDPSFDADIDPNDNGSGGTYSGTPLTYTPEEDNRGAVKAGELKEQDADKIAKTSFTPNDIAKKIDFTTTLQPGDDFRVIANGDKDFLKQLRNLDKEDAFRVVDPNVAGDVIAREVREPKMYASNILTAWRILHVERDSMDAVPTTGDQVNMVSGTITGVVGTLTEARTVNLSLNLETDLPNGPDDSLTMSDSPPGNGRFEKGNILIGRSAGTSDLQGNGAGYVYKSTGGGIDIPFTITKAGIKDTVTGNIVGMERTTTVFLLHETSGTLDARYVGGNITVAGTFMTIDSVNHKSNPPEVTVEILKDIRFKLWDDDTTFVLPELPILDVVITAYKDAYIDVVDDGGGDINNSKSNVPFILNIALTYDAIIAAMNQAGGIESDGNRRDVFWIGYVLSTYQSRAISDIDPDSEMGQPGSGAGATPARVPNLGSIIRGEHQMDILRIRAIGGDERQHRSNTVAHEIGHKFGIDYESATGIMGPFGNGATTFNSDDIALFRARIKSPGK